MHLAGLKVKQAGACVGNQCTSVASVISSAASSSDSNKW